jgi:NAD(P)-dependent dehydrogenase (short-subunit alcohol dehydrogenase family)
MQLALEDRVAIITGPAKGMGAAITEAFAAERCKIVMAGRDLAAIEPVAAGIRSRGADVLVVACDVTRETETAALAEEATRRFGRIDILVNVAGGSGPVGPSSWETSQREFEDIIELNLTGCFNTMRAVLPGMVERQYGKIVNVGGTFGMRGRAGRMAYSASKWGLRGITKSMALEAGPFGINVNLVAPGMVDGERFRSKVVPTLAAKLEISEDEAVDRHAGEYALRRITEDEDVANACLFLASPVSRQITGVDLPVDGGWASL